MSYMTIKESLLKLVWKMQCLEVRLVPTFQVMDGATGNRNHEYTLCKILVNIRPFGMQNFPYKMNLDILYYNSL